MSEANLTNFPRPVTPDRRDEDVEESQLMARPPERAGFGRRIARACVQALFVALVLAGGYLGQKFLIETKPEPPKRPVREAVSYVKTVPVVFGDFQPTLQLYGETVAGRKVELRALVAGDVTTVGTGLRDGGEVRAGDFLLQINPFNYEGSVVDTTASLAESQGRLEELQATKRSEQDSLKHDREQLAIALRDVNETRPLVKRGTVSRRVFDDRELILSQRRQAVEQRENMLKIQAARITQQKAAIDKLRWLRRQAKRRLEETKLVAPFNAYVSDANADVGKVLGVSDRVATLLDQDWIEAKFVLSDPQYGRIISALAEETQNGGIVGRPVQVLWRVGGEPVEFKARIARVGATIASDQGGVTIFARIDTPTAPVAIRPGAFVEVRVRDRRYPDVVRLPQTSIYDNNTVYVVKDNRLEPRAVNIVGSDGNFVLVQGRNLKAGDKVVQTRLSSIGTGVKVEEL